MVLPLWISDLACAITYHLIVAFQLFYLPMAFFIPPPLFMVHIQFNMLYQFWIHTEVLELSDVVLLFTKEQSYTWRV